MSEVVLLELDNLSATNHNGGALHFGLDGKLYVAVGENGNGCERPDAEQPAREDAAHQRRRDDPQRQSLRRQCRRQHGTRSGRSGIATPFRSRCSRSPAESSSTTWGQSTWEEIDDEIAGRNYGWPTCEGPFLQGTSTPCDHPEFTDPITYHGRTGSPAACAITGGDFYDPATPQFPAEYLGNYFFADFCGGWIRRIDPASLTVTAFATGISFPVDVDVDDGGSLYYLARGSGAVFKVTYTGGKVSSIAATSGPASGGTAVTITGESFVVGATATIGGAPAKGVSVTDGAHIAATVPALTPGTLDDVTVTNPSLLSGTLRKGWFADFLDVPQANPFHADVEKIFREGITTGCGNGSYCMNLSVTRAQMAAFLLRAEHGGSFMPLPCSPLPAPFPAGFFADVPCPGPGGAGDFTNFIYQLARERITSGCSASPLKFCPQSPITRAQMAVFLLRTEHIGAFPLGSYNPPAATGTVFGDVAIGAQFADFMEQLKAEGITDGCQMANPPSQPLPLFCPNAPATRSQMARFLVRTFGLP